MNTILKIIKKIFLYFFIFLIVSFFVYWFKHIYPREPVDIGKLRDKEGLERIILSFSIALLYYLLGLIGTITGRLSNPFNFFLYIYGYENEDFHRVDPEENYRRVRSES